MLRKSHVQASLIGLLVGLSCLAIVLRQVHLKQSWATLAGLNGPFLLIPLAVFLLNLPLRALRWQLIFPRSSRPGFGSCLTVLGIGNMANFLLPGRAGDLARCVLLNRTTSLNESSRALATLAVEKLLDLLALIGMVLFAVWALHPPVWVLESLRVAVGIFAGTLLALIALRYRTPQLVALVRGAFRKIHLSSFEERFDGILTSFAEGLAAVNSAGQTLTLLFLTAAIWLTEAVLIWGIAMALGLTVDLKSAVVASATIGLGLMIPAAPGGLGTYELFGTEAFKLTGLTASSAVTLTVVIHAWVSVVNVLAGFCLLGFKGISLAQLRDRLKGETTAEPAKVESVVRLSA